MKLKLAGDFSLSVEAVTQTFAILAKRGVGKTHNASVMAEEMLKAGQQIVAIDPTGAWWGLRSGFPVVIFGGEHADVPLEDGAGEVIAQAIVEGRISAVIDTSLFRKGQQRRFLIAFLETLYRLNRAAVHLFVDEADDVCPQKPFGDEAQLVGALEDVVKRGRKKGIGCSLITQRPAALNKDVLTQCEILVAMRLLHPLDIKAIKEWVNVHADPGLAEKMIGSLPSLPIGEAWFWAPGWGDIFHRVKVRRRETFDSSATPKPGEKAAAPKSLKEIDLEALGEQIKATVQRAKENDPAALKRRIRELEGHLKKSPQTVTDIEALKAMEEKGWAEATRAAERTWKQAVADRDKIIDQLVERITKIKQWSDLVIKRTPMPLNLPAPSVTKTHQASPPRAAALAEPIGDQPIPKAERLILTALSHYPQGRSKIQAALLTGYAHSGGGFVNAVGSLRTKGWIEGGSELLRITVAGQEAIGPVDPLPRGVDLLRDWQRQLPKAEREILDVLFEVYPQPLTKTDIAERTASKYQSDGGGFINALGRLRTLELVKGRREMVLSEELVG